MMTASEDKSPKHQITIYRDGRIVLDAGKGRFALRVRSSALSTIADFQEIYKLLGDLAKMARPILFSLVVESADELSTTEVAALQFWAGHERDAQVYRQPPGTDELIPVPRIELQDLPPQGWRWMEWKGKTRCNPVSVRIERGVLKATFKDDSVSCPIGSSTHRLQISDVKAVYVAIAALKSRWRLPHGGLVTVSSAETLTDLEWFVLNEALLAYQLKATNTPAPHPPRPSEADVQIPTKEPWATLIPVAGGFVGWFLFHDAILAFSTAIAVMIALSIFSEWKDQKRRRKYIGTLMARARISA